MSILPPLVLHVRLPRDYPAHNAPEIVLFDTMDSCLDCLGELLIEIWRTGEGQGVLYNWIKFLRSGNSQNLISVSGALLRQCGRNACVSLTFCLVSILRAACISAPPPTRQCREIFQIFREFVRLFSQSVNMQRCTMPSAVMLACILPNLFGRVLETMHRRRGH